MVRKKKKSVLIEVGEEWVLPVQADRKATVTQIVALYIRGERKSLSENTCQSFEVDGRQQQKPTSGFIGQSKQECLTTVGTCDSRLEILFPNHFSITVTSWCAAMDRCSGFIADAEQDKAIAEDECVRDDTDWIFSSDTENGFS